MQAISKVDKTKFLVWILEGTRRRNGLRDVRTIHNFTELIGFPATPEDIATVKKALESIVRNPLNVNLLRTDFQKEEEIFSKSAERIRNNKPLNKLKGHYFEKALRALQQAKMERTAAAPQKSTIAAEILRVLEGKEPSNERVKSMVVILKSLAENGNPRNAKEAAVRNAITEEGLEWTVGDFLEKRRLATEELHRKAAARITEAERRKTISIQAHEREQFIVNQKIERSNPNYFDETNPLKQEELKRKRKKRLGGGGKGPTHGKQQHRLTPPARTRRPYGRRR